MFQRRPEIVLLAVAGVALAAALAGVFIGHFAWGGSTTVRLTPTANRASRPFRYSGPEGGGGLFGGEGPYGGAGGTGGTGEVGGSGEGAGSSGEGGGSAGSSGVASSVTSKVDPALVDINTDLGLEGGAAAGTGIVVSPDGVVITNNHVIAGATRISATDIGNGTTYTAHVIGYDYGHDLAVLQLEGASSLKTVSFGASSSLHVGTSVATIGNAEGRGGTPSAAAGKVTALGQSITAGDEIDGSQEHLSGLIQLEGELQPGDSGGPLVNGSGEVIGLDTAASATFQFESSADEGFAIPASEVEAIAAQIREGRGTSTVHIGASALLGVLVQSQGNEGALVEDVLSGTPAAASGLSAGDIITSVNGSNISSPTALTEAMLLQHPGERAQIGWQTPTGTHMSASVTFVSGPPS